MSNRNSRFTFVDAVASVLVISVMLGAIYMVIMRKEKKNVKVATIERKLEADVTEVVEAEAPEYSENGALVKIFTASSGKLVAPRIYEFENPKLVELHPGTKEVKSMLSADHARIQFKDGITGDIEAARWWGNFKQRSYNLGEGDSN